MDRPWLQFYGDVPASIDYPAVTLHEALAITAGRVPDAVAWSYFGRESTYRELNDTVARCADALAREGLREGDRFLISMPTTPQGVIAFYAANRLGAVPALIHPLSTASEITFYLDATRARMALTLDAFYPNLAAATPHRPLERIVLARISDYLSGVKRLGFWIAKGRKIPKVPKDERVRWWGPMMEASDTPRAYRAGASIDDPAAILFSGGTTGQPKGVMLSHRNFVAEGMQAARWCNLGEGDSILAALPIFHGFGLAVCINAAFMAGGKSILVPQFSAQIVAKVLREERPNVLVGVPTLFEALARDSSLARADLSSVKACFSGADTLPRSVKEAFEAMVVARRRQRAPARRLRPHRGGLRDHGDAAARISRGLHRRPVSRHAGEDRARSAPSRRRPSATEGEICICGPAVMLGYLDDPEGHGGDPARCMRDGRTWLHTGDLGKMDADGFFYFSVRQKRMIKSSGFNVYPAQVEAVLREHPAVREACVIGVPDPAAGRARDGLRRGVQPRRRGARDGEGAHRPLPRAPHQVVVPARGRVRRRVAAHQGGQGRLSRACAPPRNARAGPMSAAAVPAHGGERVAAALEAHGVRLIFTLCGGHISPILVAAKARGIRIVDVRDEATAVFAADAVARLTGSPGVAAVTAGPGLTNTITALKNAQLAQSPVLLLGGAAPTALQGRGALQDIDQKALASRRT